MSKVVTVRLLNDGGFGDMEDYNFNAEIPAVLSHNHVLVSTRALISNGADEEAWLSACRTDPVDEPQWCFYVGSECEVIEAGHHE